MCFLLIKYFIILYSIFHYVIFITYYSLFNNQLCNIVTKFCIISMSNFQILLLYALFLSNQWHVQLTICVLHCSTLILKHIIDIILILIFNMQHAFFFVHSSLLYHLLFTNVFFQQVCCSRWWPYFSGEIGKYSHTLCGMSA